MDHLETPSPDPEKSFSHRLAVLLVIPLVVLFVGLFVTLYITHATAYVEGPSMEPTLKNTELVLYTRGSDELYRGDVVIIRLELTNGDTGVIVKRIVAVEGDEIEVERGNAIVNGAPEKGDHTVIVSEDDVSVPRQIVPDGHLYVLGDNRPVSDDSRFIGPVPEQWVEGKVIAVIGPITNLRRVD